MATWICALGGAAAGHVASTRQAPQYHGGRRRLPYGGGDEWETFDSEDEELTPRGLDPAIIEGHTVGHVYNGPAAAPPGPVARGAPGGPGGGAPLAGGEENNKCMVCMEEFAAGESLRSLPCMHRYHMNCIDEWLARSRECPICKRDITEQVQPQDLTHRVSGRSRAVIGLGPRLMRARQMLRRRSNS